MRNLILIIIAVLGFGCTSAPDKITVSTNLPIEIDSTCFVRNLEYERIGYKEFLGEDRIQLPIEDVNKIYGELFLFRLFSVGEIYSEKDFTVELLYAARSDKMALDAYFEIYILATIDSNQNLISAIEIAKFEAHPGSDTETYCSISSDFEIFVNEVETVGFDPEDQVITKKNLKYQIEKSGIIKLCQ